MTPEVVAAVTVLSSLMQRAVEGRLSEAALQQLQELSEREVAQAIKDWEEEKATEGGTGPSGG